MPDFKTPDIKYYPRPLFFWNDTPNEEALKEIMQKNIETGYGGVGVLAYDACNVEYMSDEYFKAYETVLKQAKESGQKVCLYDEWWFPSGSAGGRLKKKYPEACARSLETEKYKLNKGDNIFERKSGKIMAVVAVKINTYEIINIYESFVQNNSVKWEKDGEWEIMIFYCRLSDWDRVNYLDPDAVRKFIEITHEEYYKRFPEYFGNVIDSSFYDEPQFYAVGGRMWTEDFNAKFIQRKGYDPSLLYPALCMDIGEETAHARNELLGFRADLYAEGFPKIIQEWCTAHGIALAGHVDQEEMVNPCGITGDLMKSFKYQDIPGVDEISYPGRGSKIYKIISSAAYNWNKKYIMTECFGAMDNLTEWEIYREIMDLYVKGINYFVPHAIWLNTEKVFFKPELSWRNEYYGKILYDINMFSARLSSVLQEGAHVSHTAVLYPIEGLQSQYNFNWCGNPYEGGPYIKENNYQDIGEYIFYECNHDFTYVHPDRLKENIKISGGVLSLEDNIHKQNYSAVIITGQDTVSAEVLETVKDFYLSGGTVIATSLLPSHSSEKGLDKNIKDTLVKIFGTDRMTGEIIKNENAGGGKAWLIPCDKTDSLREILKNDDITFDKNFPGLGYIHKSTEKHEIYYIVNKSDNNIFTETCIYNNHDHLSERGELWNPYDGTKTKIILKNTQDMLSAVLQIDANRSAFLVLIKIDR